VRVRAGLSAVEELVTLEFRLVSGSVAIAISLSVEGLGTFV